MNRSRAIVEPMSADAVDPILPAPDTNEHRRAIQVAFTNRFGHAPTCFGIAPGRVNLIGEHTDYNDGFVMPVAINRETIIAAAPTAKGPSTFVAHTFDRELEINLETPHDPVPKDSPDSFINYPLGVIEHFRDTLAQSGWERRIPNLNVFISSSVPIGSGLSSSASVEVAMLQVLQGVTGFSLSPVEGALLCQRAEHTYAGTPCGIMDMFISLMGVAGHALLIDCRTNESRAIPLPAEADCTVLIIDTLLKHDLAAGEYAERRATCMKAARSCGVESLREATLAMLEPAGLDEITRRRASHVVTENTRVLLAAAALQQHDLDTFSDLLFASHESLRDLYEVSCPELDTIVDAARAIKRRAPRAVIGARMTGGGFGGCAIILCRADAAKAVAFEVLDAFSKHHGHAPRIYATPTCSGAHLLMP